MTKYWVNKPLTKSEIGLIKLTIFITSVYFIGLV